MQNSSTEASQPGNLTDPKAQAARREQWYALARERIHEVFNPDGTGKIPQFDPPYREPVWVLPALYNGPRESIDLANRIVERYNAPASTTRWGVDWPVSGAEFNIFQTNCFCELYHDYRRLLTPGAEKTMRWHAEMAGRTYAGSAQPDFVFRGGNDNMPAHATCGLVAAGQALGDEAMLTHARWNLRQLRAALSRSGWMGEFNSPTYTGGTLAYIAKIATISRDEEIRSLALEIEHRIWAEVLLHYHPGTLHHAGPMSRAYCIDYAGHNHNLHLLVWYAFGPEAMGRDLVASYFHPDGQEVIHFAGCYWQTIAESAHLMDTELHVPAGLAWLATGRKYPAILRGRAEVNLVYNYGAQIQTETYMREAFSLGTCNATGLGGEQTASLYVTYRRGPEMRSFRDAATIFYKYRMDDQPLGQLETSNDGHFQGERYLYNQAWCYTSQKENSAVLLCAPNPVYASIDSAALKMNLMFPAHFGRITASIVGDAPACEGAAGESVGVVPVSVEAGEVYIHIQPLIPTSLPRRAAVRFSRQNGYEVLELVNYEGEKRHFTALELSRVLNGFVITIDEPRNHPSLEAFHRAKSAARVVDYLFVGTRYFEYLRDDVWFRIAMTPAPPGAMIDMVDGLPRAKPIFESNQVDATALPFLNERVEPNFDFFPWEKLDINNWPNSWIIGSRGLCDETPYSRRAESLQPVPDGPR